MSKFTAFAGEPVARVKMGGLTIADVYASRREPEDQNETAMLFAAAPELLAALEAIVDEAGPLMGHNPKTMGSINRIAWIARQAIAKATGDQA